MSGLRKISLVLNRANFSDTVNQWVIYDAYVSYEYQKELQVDLLSNFSKYFRALRKLNPRGDDLICKKGSFYLQILQYYGGNVSNIIISLFIIRKQPRNQKSKLLKTKRFCEDSLQWPF